MYKQKQNKTKNRFFIVADSVNGIKQRENSKKTKKKKNNQRDKSAKIKSGMIIYIWQKEKHKNPVHDSLVS